MRRARRIAEAEVILPTGVFLIAIASTTTQEAARRSFRKIPEMQSNQSGEGRN
jgi:hypothetical protein